MGRNPLRRQTTSRGWEQRAVTGITQQIHALDPLVQRKYLRDFYGAFQSYQCTVSQEQVESELLAADIVLLGDYHTLPASQHYAAQIVELMGQNGKSCCLGVEAIFAEHQALLDAWWKREISDQQLRLLLRFDDDWGYAWEPVRELLQAARGCGFRVCGLDSGPRSNLRAIRKRDRHAATRIAELRATDPRTAVLALFGESHLAPGHLPGMLRARRPKDRIVTILQNCDALYWQLAVDSDGNKPAVQIADGVFCVFTASLFEKYDSYREYLNVGTLFSPADKNL
ncbi:MAG TPA: ChaN family lipoprotein [Terriglobales bacterium]|nr:ChaN family lipoprotein [Terriglobales bacterium]